MNYIYVGKRTAFLDLGDIFEPSKGGKGYVHHYDHPNFYMSLPKYMVENSDDFEPHYSDEIKEVRKNIGFLRQFINENKVVGHKLITDEEIEEWLFEFGPECSDREDK